MMATMKQIVPLSLPSVPEPDKRLQALWVVCDQLPKNNKANLRWVTDGLVHTTLLHNKDVCIMKICYPVS